MRNPFAPFVSRVSRERAIELAKAECVRRGVPIREPVYVSSVFFSRTWRVLTNADSAGANAVVLVDKRDGRIRGFAVTPR